MTAPIFTNRPASSANTPEEYFTPRPNPEEEIPVDAVLCALSRAQAVLLFIQTNGENIKQGFTINHSSVMDSLNCVDGLLTQVITMIDHSIGLNVKS